MEGGACSGPGDESPCVGGRIAHELLRNLLCPDVIGNAADDQGAQRDQLDKTRSRSDRGATKPDLRLQGVDLCAGFSRAIVPSVSGCSAIMTRQAV